MDINAGLDDFVLGRLMPQDLPRCAQDSLEKGFDSPTLRILAVSEGASSEELLRLFRRALTELKIPLPTLEFAALSAAKTIAQAIVDGAMDPYNGAKLIWRDVYLKAPTVQRLRVFVGLASEYEDDEQNREAYRKSILDEARSLIVGG